MTSSVEIDIPYPDASVGETMGVDVVFFTIAQVCGCAVTLTGVGVDSTHVRVTFDRAVLDNQAVRHSGVWEIIMPVGSGPVTVLDVVPEQNPIGSVLLTTTEHVSLPNYEIVLHYLETA